MKKKQKNNMSSSIERSRGGEEKIFLPRQQKKHLEDYIGQYSYKNEPLMFNIGYLACTGGRMSTLCRASCDQQNDYVLKALTLSFCGFCV